MKNKPISVVWTHEMGCRNCYIDLFWPRLSKTPLVSIHWIKVNREVVGRLHVWFARFRRIEPVFVKVNTSAVGEGV